MTRNMKRQIGFYYTIGGCLTLLLWSVGNQDLGVVRCFATSNTSRGLARHLTPRKSSTISTVKTTTITTPVTNVGRIRGGDKSRRRFELRRQISHNHDDSMDRDGPGRAGSISNSNKESSQSHESTIEEDTSTKIGPWPCMDEMDRKLIKISLPVIGNYAIGPLIGAVDLFWVNRMGSALYVAGQAAANQVFSSAFWFVSFLPSVTATIVSKAYASGDEEETQNAICQALFVGFFIALIGQTLMLLYPDRALSSVLSAGAPALKYAKPYLLIRSFAFLPSLISLVGFSAYRGILDTSTPVKISGATNVINAVLDPILIFWFALGVPGAALATLAAEIASAITYLVLLKKRQLIQWRKLVKPPSWENLSPLLRGGSALQIRNLSLNLVFLAVARVVQSIDRTGVAAAAHALSIQTFQIGGIVLLALSTVAQTVVPSAMVAGSTKLNNQKQQKGVVGNRNKDSKRSDSASMDLSYAKATVNRLMSWGFLLGCGLGALQLLLLPVIRKTTPLQEVRDVATIPAIIASILQIINGLVFIGEGVMIGTGSFMQLSLSTLVATIGCLIALAWFPPTFGLTGVWIGFGVFNVLRLVGVGIHQCINGPLAPKKMAPEVPSDRNR